MQKYQFFNTILRNRYLHNYLETRVARFRRFQVRVRRVIQRRNRASARNDVSGSEAFIFYSPDASYKFSLILPPLAGRGDAGNIGRLRPFIVS